MNVKKILKIFIYVFYAGLIAFTLFNIRSFTVEEIISYTPSNKLFASLFLIFLYALKSLTVFFPVALLQLAGGFLFPAPIALLVNCLGSLSEFAAAYFVGLFSGSDALEKKVMKNEHIRALFKKQDEHKFFVCFFLRVISCLPCDLVSMYFGAARLPFHIFISASFLGTLPGIIPITFMGSSITNPSSPQFLFSVSFTVLCSLISVIAFYIHCRKNK